MGQQTDLEWETHTQGKKSFDSLYNAVDAVYYMREMQVVGYQIADHTAAIALRAMESLLRDADKVVPATASVASDGHGLPPVILELCSGYGLSIAPIKTTLKSASIVEHYTAIERPTELTEALHLDRNFFATHQRRNLPEMCVVGADVASNALAYAKAVGLFDETICRNFEDTTGVVTESLTEDDRALCSRARLVLATGAFSYITPRTLQKLFACWDEGQRWRSYPVFLFFPLVATDVTEIVRLFKDHGLDVYYEPSQHWLPQRWFASEVEAATVEALQEEVVVAAGRSRPEGARDGCLHATPLIAGPPGRGIASGVALEWINTPSTTEKSK